MNVVKHRNGWTEEDRSSIIDYCPKTGEQPKRALVLSLAGDTHICVIDYHLTQGCIGVAYEVRLRRNLQEKTCSAEALRLKGDWMLCGRAADSELEGLGNQGTQSS